MPTTIVTKYGVSPGVPPLPSELEVGEVAVNHGDGQMYTKKGDGTVISIGGGGDPGTLPTGTDGDILTNVSGVWAVQPSLQFGDNPDKPGQRELQIFNNQQLTQYSGADTTEPAVEFIGDTLDENGVRIFQPTNVGIFGIELECDSGNSSSLLMRKPGTTNEGILLETGGNDASLIRVDGPVESTGGTSIFSGISMEGTNPGINMNDLGRVFNHPDPTGATTTNVANARWVNNNYLGINAKAADSDNLDGISSSGFVRNATGQNVSGTYTYTNAGGLVGLGVLRLNAFNNSNSGLGSIKYVMANSNGDLYVDDNPALLNVGAALSALLTALSNAGVTLAAPELATINGFIADIEASNAP